MRAPALAGRNLGDIDVRIRTNCTVLAVERGDEVLAGNDDAIDAFAQIAHWASFALLTGPLPMLARSFRAE